MRSFWLCSLVLLAVGILVVSCNTADPNECFPNTSGGFGGSGTIPIGAGVGVTSGGDFASPRFGPLGYTDANNPCVTHDSNTSQPKPPAPPAQGTSSSRGTGSSEPPPCNQVLIGPPVTPTPGGSGGGSTSAGGGGAGGSSVRGSGLSSSGAGGGDPNPGDAVSQMCVDGSELSTYIRCRGLTPLACEEACFNIGANCNALLGYHPYGSMGGTGRLKQCQSNTLNYTCTYCYDNGDVCTRTKLKGFPSFWLCSYTNGKGCD